MTQVDIGCIDRVQLRNIAWMNHASNNVCILRLLNQPLDDIMADKDAVDYLEHFQERPILSTLIKRLINPCYYDVIYGRGAFRRIVDELRKE